MLARNEKIFTEALELELRDNDVNYLTLAFCRHLAQNYEHLDLLDVFNEFQHKVKTYIEMFNYRTVDTNLFEEVKGLDFLLMIPNEDGIFYVPTLGKLKFYRDFFGDTYKKEKHPDIEAVYLLLDLDSSNIKIGQSRKMIHRERTLQAQKPSIELIAYWISPKQVETQLHQMFKSKRLRGEWFKLSFADLKTIKKFMESISVPTGLSVPAGFSPDTPTT
ncbi:GIY-YIG nuclease family protein [Ferruginibacter sp.]|nr:GIY-YIG nuclease family protein [Ferruginibacter sp.]